MTTTPDPEREKLVAALDQAIAALDSAGSELVRAKDAMRHADAELDRAHRALVDYDRRAGTVEDTP